MECGENRLIEDHLPQADSCILSDFAKGVVSPTLARRFIRRLASFDETNGQFPAAGLVLDSSGDLFGTTSSGGANGYGTVFEIANGTTSITTLASFDGTDGDYPAAGLIRESSGNLYGTTEGGGANGDGTIFELTPTTTTVTSSVNPSVWGQSVTFTATVSSNDGTPTGTVEFLGWQYGTGHGNTQR